MSTTHQPTPDTDEDEIVANPHQRVGRLRPTTETANQLANYTDLLVPTEPDVVGGTLDDTDRVKECLSAAVDYYHDNLPDPVRDAIKKKWGLSDSMIDARKIGYVDDSNDVVDHLLSNGFNETTIARAGLASSSVLNHLFGCTGVSPENKHLLPDSRLPEEVDKSCHHTGIPDAVDILVRGQLQGHIKPQQIDLEAVLTHVADVGELTLWNWWDHRIIFPYKNQDGEHTYLIGRATDKTDDRVYSNGIVDMADEKIRTVADTRLGEQMNISDEDLSDFVLLQHRDEVFKTPDQDGHEEPVRRVTALIDDAVRGDIDHGALASYGVIYDPDATSVAETEDTATVTIYNPVGDEVVVDPAAIGVQPGDSITFRNETEHDVELTVAETPYDAWWDDGNIDEVGSLECSERGHYRYKLTVGDQEFRGSVIAYDTIYTDSRNLDVESWVGEEPGFTLDIAKYVKQTIDRPWINHDAVTEPIFGIDTVHEGKPLLVTEGVTDALMAHQHGFPCIAPATTNIKAEHFDQLPENISTVYIVNDNETNNAGLNGALRNAKVFENNGQTALVGELPRPDDQDKIDLAEFLQNNSKDDLLAVLEDAVPAEQHSHFDPAQHDPSFHYSQSNASSDTRENTSRDGERSSELSDDVLDSDTTSALYSLTLEDVIDWDRVNASGSSSTAGSVIYRGENPIQHHGNSEGYFVIRDHGDYITAKDYKISATGDGYYYNRLTWLATAAPDTDRTVTNPAGPLSNEEIWKIWKYAKEAEHIDFPDDDPIPLRAIWYIAEEHELYPPEMIPDSFDDTDGDFPKRLTETPFNNALDIIKEEYGLNPGRDYRDH